MSIIEKALQKFELTELYNNFPGVIVSLKLKKDFTEECLFISENCIDFFGYSAKELRADWNQFLGTINTHDKEQFRSLLEQALKSNKRIVAEGRYMTKAGKEIWLKFSAHIIQRDEDFILQGIYIDITSEKIAELKEEALKDALISLSRHPVIHQGDLKNIGEYCVRLISYSLNVSRSSLWLYNEEKQTIYCDKLFDRTANEVYSGAVLHKTDFGPYFEAMLTEPYIKADDARTHTVTNCFNESYFIPNDIFSLLDIPVFYKGKVIAVLCQEQTGDVRVWTKAEVDFLFHVAELISYSYSISERNKFEKEMEYVNKNLAELVKQKTIELSQKNKDILDSIRYAKRIQKSILPGKKKVYKLLEDSFILYKPKDIVAGDFYWLEKQNDEVLFAVCDCTGHGIPGAFVSLIAYKILQRAIVEFNLVEPNEILDKVNQLFKVHFSKRKGDVRDGMDIGLIRFKRLEDGSVSLKYAGANIHFHYALPKENYTIRKCLANKQAIGYSEESENFNLHSLTLPKDAMVYMFSDGYADQFGGSLGRKIGTSNLLQLLQQNAHLTTEEQNTTINNYFSEWKGNNDQIDDVLVAGIRV